jgi:hypothetical protein
VQTYRTVELSALRRGQPSAKELAGLLDVAAAARDPPVQRLARFLDPWSTQAPDADGVAEPDEHFGHSVEPGLVDTGLGLSGPPSALPT